MCLRFVRSIDSTVASIGDQVEVILPRDRQHWLELRAANINSTEISALYNASPYMTEFELDHLKRTKSVVEIEDNERMKWGRRLQDSIAKGIAEDQGWEIRRVDEYMWDPVYGLGSSFDFFIGDDGILEIKNVDALAFREGWLVGEDGGIEAPPHIEFQLQLQLRISKRKYGVIGALVGGNKIVLIQRDANPALHDDFERKAVNFWGRIRNDEPVQPDFVKDASLLAKIYMYAEPGKVLDASENGALFLQAVQYKELGEQIKELEAMRSGVKSEILIKIGDAEKVLGGMYTITAGTTGPVSIEAHERKGFRQFRVNWKKGTKGT